MNALKSSLFAMGVASCFALPAGVSAAPVPLGQIDTFETWSDGWFTGGVVAPGTKPASSAWSLSRLA